MAAVYATVEDVNLIGRKLTADEQDKAAQLLPIASAKLRTAAAKYGKSLDGMIHENEDLVLVVKETVIKAVLRALDSSADSNPPAVQSSQSALGYSLSMTYLNSGQSLYFLKNELKELGLLRQRFGALEVFGYGNDNQGD
jgi:hypothetical protein